jgi:hypothetical protein
MNLVVTGIINKQIAGQLGISEVTVKIHRRQVMEKMNAESLADLVRMSDKFKNSNAEVGPRKSLANPYANLIHSIISFNQKLYQGVIVPPGSSGYLVTTRAGTLGCGTKQVSTKEKTNVCHPTTGSKVVILRKVIPSARSLARRGMAPLRRHAAAWQGDRRRLGASIMAVATGLFFTHVYAQTGTPEVKAADVVNPLNTLSGRWSQRFSCSACRLASPCSKPASVEAAKP